MPTWNHRVLKFEKPEETYYAVHEVHYDDAGRPRAYAQNATSILWDCDEGLEIGRKIVDQITLAFTKPVLLAKDFE